LENEAEAEFNDSKAGRENEFNAEAQRNAKVRREKRLLEDLTTASKQGDLASSRRCKNTHKEFFSAYLCVSLRLCVEGCFFLIR